MSLPTKGLCLSFHHLKSSFILAMVGDSLPGPLETKIVLQKGQTPVDGAEGAPQFAHIISKLMTASLRMKNKTYHYF